MAPNAWPAVVPSEAGGTTRCREYLDSSFELNLLQPFFVSAIKPGTKHDAHEPGGPGNPTRESPTTRRAVRAFTGPSPAILLLAVALLLALTSLSCTRDIGGVSSGWNALAASDGVVYVGTKDGRVQALMDNGFEGVRAGWSFPPAEGTDNLKGVYASPLVAAGLLYVAGENGFLYALDPETGAVSDRGWRRPQGQPQSIAPFVGGPAYDPINELVIAPSEDGRLYDFDADTGASIWDRPFSTADKIWSTPTVSNSVAFFGSHDHRIYAVNLATGEEVWSFETGGVVAGKPLVFDGMVIVGSFDRILYALNALDGSVLWRFEGENWFWAGPVTNGETIFAPSMDGHIYALDRSGILRWKYDAGDAIVSPPVLVPRGLVVAARNGRLVLLDVSSSGSRTSDQRILSSQLLGDSEIMAPLVAVGESVYVGSEDGSVRRVEVKGGQVQMWCWHYENTVCN